MYENKSSIFHHLSFDLTHKNTLILHFVHHYPAVVDQVSENRNCFSISIWYDSLFLGRVKRKNMRKGEKGAAADEDADED